MYARDRFTAQSGIAPSTIERLVFSATNANAHSKPTVNAVRRLAGHSFLRIANSAKNRLFGRASILVLAVAFFFRADLCANAQDVQHLTVTQPGGFPGLPVV